MVMECMAKVGVFRIREESVKKWEHFSDRFVLIKEHQYDETICRDVLSSRGTGSPAISVSMEMVITYLHGS